MPIVNANRLANSPAAARSWERLDLSLLRHFFAVASYGGFSKASRALGISQPALSLGLQKLERALGLPLVNRSAPFGLTPAGVKLLAFCQEMEGGLDAFFAGIGRLEQRIRPRYRVGTAFSVGSAAILGFCQRSGMESEPFEVEIVNGSSFQLIADLHAGLIDAAIVSDDVHDDRVRLQRLAEDKVVFVTSPRYARIFNKFPWMEATPKVPFVQYPRDTSMRSMVDRLCVRHQLRFLTSITASGVDLLKTLVLHGVGAGFVLSSLVREEIGAGELIVPARMPFSLPKRGIMLAVRPGERNRPLSQLIVDCWKNHQEVKKI